MVSHFSFDLHVREHPFGCPLTIWIPSLVRSLLIAFVHFSIEWFICFCSVYGRFLHLRNITTFSIICVTKKFPSLQFGFLFCFVLWPYVWCLFFSTYHAHLSFSLWVLGLQSALIGKSSSIQVLKKYFRYFPPNTYFP